MWSLKWLCVPVGWVFFRIGRKTQNIHLYDCGGVELMATICSLPMAASSMIMHYATKQDLSQTGFMNMAVLFWPLLSPDLNPLKHFRKVAGNRRWVWRCCRNYVMQCRSVCNIVLNPYHNELRLLSVCWNTLDLKEKNRSYKYVKE